MKLTLSVIKADIGGYVGHSESHPDILADACEGMDKAKRDGLLIDYHVTKCGDDLQLIMTHQLGVSNEKIHKLAWDRFVSGTEIAKKLKLYGAGQDLLADAFSGNVRGMGPGVAEMEFEERRSEPVIIFMADKTHPARGICRSTRCSPTPSTPSAWSSPERCIRGLPLKSSM
jgi:fructose 1,6-bisphosphate aldolase/phosphatase